MKTSWIDLALLVAFFVGAIWTVLRGSLLRAVIALAVTSTILTLIMFRLASPLAAVFELSVCAGLITVVFVSVISLTAPRTHAETLAASRGRGGRYGPLLLILAAVALFFCELPPVEIMAPLVEEPPARQLLWLFRQADLAGMALALLAGILGVIALFPPEKAATNHGAHGEHRDNE